MSNGFPGGRINSLTQTPDGYLWIGTSKGLVRFDGFSFAYVGAPDDPTTQISQAVSLVPSNDGALWVWDQDLNVKRYIHGRFDDAALLPSGGSVVSAIARSTEGDLLLATQAPQLFQRRTEVTEPLTGGGNLGIPAPQTIAQTEDGKIWLATYEAGLFYWDRGRVVAIEEGVPDKINCLLTIRSSDLWIGTDEGAVLWDGQKISVRIPARALGGARVLSLAGDRDSNIWIGTSNGLYRWNADGLRRIGDAQQGSKRTITAIFEDREGNLWIGDARGLERLRDGSFTSVTLGTSGAEQPTSGPLYRDSADRVWTASSHGGLYCVLNGQAMKIPFGNIGLDVIYSIAGHGNELWLGRREGGLTHLVQTGGSRPVVHEVWTYTRLQGLAQNSVSSVFRSSDGTIWAGTLSGGVDRLRNDKFTALTAAEGLGSNTISSIQEDRDGAMWFGTSDGLSRLQNGQVKTLRARDGLPSDEVTTLLMDSSGILWVGTSQGLSYFSVGRLHPIHDSHAALHESIFGIAEDREGFLWLTSSNHVFRIRRTVLLQDRITEAAYREFDVSDGLRIPEGVRRDRSVITDAKGRVWVSTLNGLALFRGSSVYTEPGKPHVEWVSSDGKRIGPDSTLNLAPEPQRITIAYDAVSLAVPNRMRYRYKLAGFDHDWSEPTEERQVVYTNLGPGAYQFQLQASQDGEEWKVSENVLSLHIQPTLLQTWWFRLLWIATATMLAIALYQLRVRLIARNMSDRFNERLEERTRMARELHDTFLQTVQGSKLVADDALSPDADDARMRNAMEKLACWLSQAVVEGRAALQALRVSTVEENELAELLDSTLKECHNSMLSVTLSVIGNPRALHPIVQDEITLIAREAVRNACTHARASHLRATLTYAADLSLCIRDNGVGIAPEILEEGKEGHFGLVGMQERSARIAGKITIHSSSTRGTEVLLRLPGHICYKQNRRSLRDRFVASFTRRFRTEDR